MSTACMQTIKAFVTTVSYFAQSTTLKSTYVITELHVIEAILLSPTRLLATSAQ